MMTMMKNRLGGKKAATAMIRNIAGIAAQSSKMRDNSRSSHPPKYPAMAPSNTPTASEMPTETRPMTRA